MACATQEVHFDTEGETHIIEITKPVCDRVAETGIADGLVAVFAPGATAGITTLEYEPGAVADLQACLERLAPQEMSYAHDRAYGDGNGHSHVRAALLGPGLTIPLRAGQLVLGTWQRIVFIDFDNRPRQRTVVVQCVGDRQ